MGLWPGRYTSPGRQPAVKSFSYLSSRLYSGALGCGFTVTRSGRSSTINIIRPVLRENTAVVKPNVPTTLYRLVRIGSHPPVPVLRPRLDFPGRRVTFRT